jgi:hypothetical protein
VQGIKFHRVLLFFSYRLSCKGGRNGKEMAVLSQLQIVCVRMWPRNACFKEVIERKWPRNAPERTSSEFTVVIFEGPSLRVQFDFSGTKTFLPFRRRRLLFKQPNT